MNDSLAIRHCLRPVMRFKRDMARSKSGSWNWGLIWCLLGCALFWFVLFWFLFQSDPAHAQVFQPAVDMHKIMMIESSGNPMAHNKTDDSIGLFQITPVCLKEWNQYHPGKQYSREDLWNPAINKEIADWYINIRIPQMLKHYHKEDTVPNRITAYNAGINYIVHDKPLPKITQLYLKKYYR